MALNAANEEVGKRRSVGALTATGAAPTFRPHTNPNGSTNGRFNAVVFGTFVGTVVLERSFDNGVTWIAARDATDAAISVTAPASYQLRENENGVAYRWRCSAFTSGTINTRLSQ